MRQTPGISPVSIAAGRDQAPSAATLELIQTTWAELLGVARVGAHDDFFDLGGNSLIVAAAVAKLGERIGIESSRERRT